jgi:Skp family chaperone for outer membrane proteins
VKRAVLTAAALLALAGCAAQSSPIATVDLERIQANWPKFINYSNQLAADTDAINRSSASPKQKQAQLDALRARYADMQNEVTDDLRNAAAQIATQRHFQIIVTRQFVGYGGVDITPDVEKILQITEKAPAKS